jgi:hypothetical protein
MIPRPTPVCLSLCDSVIVEEGTRKISLINSFSTIRLSQFPKAPQPFCVFSTLTDAQGEGMVELSVTRLETDEEIYAVRRTLGFADRVTDLSVLYRIGNCVFPARGAYLFTILVDGEWIAHRRIRLELREGQ